MPFINLLINWLKYIREVCKIQNFFVAIPTFILKIGAV